MGKDPGAMGKARINTEKALTTVGKPHQSPQSRRAKGPAIPHTHKKGRLRRDVPLMIQPPGYGNASYSSTASNSSGPTPHTGQT